MIYCHYRIPLRPSLLGPALWVLDSGQISTRPSKVLRLVFKGRPWHPTQASPTYHIMARGKVFTRNPHNTTSTTRPSVVQDGDFHLEPDLEDKDSLASQLMDLFPGVQASGKIGLDGLDTGKTSQVRQDAEKTSRVRRDTEQEQTEGDVMPVVTSVEPLTAPEDGTLLYIYGRHLGPSNVTITVGNKTCHCRGAINRRFFPDQGSCKYA